MMKCGFSRPKKWKPFSWAIMKVLGVNYSHAYLVFDVESTEQLVIYQANRSGVICTSFKSFAEHNTIVESIEIESKEKRTKALFFCIDKLGRPYSLLTVISIYLKKKFGINPKYNDGENAFICSELVARALGINADYVDSMDPKELMELLKS